MKIIYLPSTLRYLLFLTVFFSRETSQVDGHLLQQNDDPSDLRSLGPVCRPKAVESKRWNTAVLYWMYYRSYSSYVSRVAERRQNIWLRNQNSLKMSEVGGYISWIGPTLEYLSSISMRTCCSVVAGCCGYLPLLVTQKGQYLEMRRTK